MELDWEQRALKAESELCTLQEKTSRAVEMISNERVSQTLKTAEIKHQHQQEMTLLQNELLLEKKKTAETQQKILKLTNHIKENTKSKPESVGVASLQELLETEQLLHESQEKNESNKILIQELKNKVTELSTNESNKEIEYSQQVQESLKLAKERIVDLNLKVIKLSEEKDTAIAYAAQLRLKFQRVEEFLQLLKQERDKIPGRKVAPTRSSTIPDIASISQRSAETTYTFKIDGLAKNITDEIQGSLQLTNPSNISKQRRKNTKTMTFLRKKDKNSSVYLDIQNPLAFSQEEEDEEQDNIDWNYLQNKADSSPRSEKKAVLKKRKSLPANRLNALLKRGAELSSELGLGVSLSQMVFQIPEVPSYTQEEPNLIWISRKKKLLPAKFYEFNDPSEKRKAIFTLIYCNAGFHDFVQMQQWTSLLGDVLGINVISFDYTGYGLNTGKASENACTKDLTAVYNYLKVEKNITPDKILLLGKGIGAGVIINFFTELRKRKNSLEKTIAGGVILQSTFTSVLELLQLGKKTTTSDLFDNLKKIKNLNSKTLIIHGSKDETIPCSHGNTLAKAVPENLLYKFVSLKDAGHLDIENEYSDDILEVLLEFVENLTPSDDKQDKIDFDVKPVAYQTPVSIISDFLKPLGLESYTDILLNNGYSTKLAIESMDDVDLDILGIYNVDHRRLLLRKLKTVKP